MRYSGARQGGHMGGHDPGVGAGYSSTRSTTSGGPLSRLAEEAIGPGRWGWTVLGGDRRRWAYDMRLRLEMKLATEDFRSSAVAEVTVAGRTRITSPWSVCVSLG
eukprot:EG_transcript_23684